MSIILLNHLGCAMYEVGSLPDLILPVGAHTIFSAGEYGRRRSAGVVVQQRLVLQATDAEQTKTLWAMHEFSGAHIIRPPA